MQGSQQLLLQLLLQLLVQPLLQLLLQLRLLLQFIGKKLLPVLTDGGARRAAGAGRGSPWSGAGQKAVRLFPSYAEKRKLCGRKEGAERKNPGLQLGRPGTKYENALDNQKIKW